MNYLYIDGDDIGLKIEKNFMDNSEEKLAEINNTVKEIIAKITEYLVNNHFQIIFDGADGIICKREKANVKTILTTIREFNSPLNFSIGAGDSLREAYLALRYAKCNGKNIAALYIDEKLTLIK